MNGFHYDAPDEAATDALGQALADVLPPGTTVALRGTLGAGKTRLTQAIAVGMGIQRSDVISPTFVLAREYRAERTLYHIDAYRLRDEDEFEELGPDEYFESDGITVIEWADRVEGCLPKQRVQIDIEITGPTSRRFAVTAVGDRYVPAVKQCEQRVQQ
ncbi:MAG: tRNA (adenosine(37)-N6)-threonylcarbamoyltransferase complex ATPase subunit type 1 TsaE [Thermoguttaceae bacterium]